MHKLHKLLLLVVFFSCFVCSNSFATGGGVVISAVQLGNLDSAKNEFVELYNNSDRVIEVTNWCLYYQSSTLFQTKMVCLSTESQNQHLFLPSFSSIFIVSEDYVLSDPEIKYDFSFPVNLSGTAGYVRLADSNSQEIDRVGWGSKTPENDLAIAPTAGSVLSRKSFDEKTLIDTDSYGGDFIVDLPKTSYTYNSIYEEIDVCGNIDGIQLTIPGDYIIDESGLCNPPPVDICLNVEGFQLTLPVGYGVNGFNECHFDACMNIDGIQSITPDGYDNKNYFCIEHDECLNIDDIQQILPDGMLRTDEGKCYLIASGITLSEILPNVSGVDEGNEYIEIYNPNDFDVILDSYQLCVGVNFDKCYSFLPGQIIKTKSFLAISNDDVRFTLLNTTGAVRIIAEGGQMINQSDVYVNPKEDISWALIDGAWKYTNQFTIGYENKPWLEKGDVLGVVVELAPCASGYYRSSETNRCRKIVDSSTELAPCKDGQYRSEETNRCRSIVSDVAALVPCSEGEERNPDTNRCRKIVTVSTTLAPCKEGEERNSETNRCRKIASNSMPKVDYKPVVVGNSNQYLINWSIGLILIFSFSYGVWEWRWEISKLFKAKNN